jgi:hypothetical protein
MNMSFRLLFLFLCAFPLLAEESEPDLYSLPDGKRPRIRIRDQRPVVYREGMRFQETEEEKDLELDPEAMSGIRMSSDRQFGFSEITSIPQMGPAVQRDGEDERDEAPSSSWVSALDLLGEQDLIADPDEDVEEDENTENTPMEWGDLQDSIIEEGLTVDEPAAQEDSEQGEDGGRSASESRAEVDAGLGLEATLSTNDISNEQPEVMVDSDLPSGVQTPSRESMAMALDMNLMRAVPENRFSSEGEDMNAEPSQDVLSGSRKMFNDIKERWEPSSSVPTSSSPSSFFARESRPSVSPIPEAAMSRPSINSSAIQPARLERVRLPGRETTPSAIQNPTGTQTGFQRVELPKPEAIDRNLFRQDDGRVRSNIGITP